MPFTIQWTLKCELSIEVDLVVDVSVSVGVYVTVYTVFAAFNYNVLLAMHGDIKRHFCLVLVPCVAPPNIPTPPSELDIANIPVCCAGVQFNLDYLDDPAIHVQASIDGILHPANQVVIDGNSLYIMGLQAGTEYSLNIMLSNKFGSAWTDTSVTPLLGGLVSDECYNRVLCIIM